MNATILRRLVWKEFRTTAALWLAMVGLCFFLQLAAVTQFNELSFIKQSQQDVTGWLYAIAVLMAALYAVACAGMQYALEHENGTFGLLRSLPLGVREVAAAKTGWTIVTTAVLLPVLCAMALVMSGGLPPEAWAWRIAAVFGVNILECFVWGTLFSLLLSRPMIAILEAGLAVTVFLVAIGSVVDIDSAAAVACRLFIVAVVAAIDARLALRWFERWKIGRQGLPIVQSLSEGMGGSWRMSPRRRRPEFVGLCLHHARQSRAILGLCAFFVFLWFVTRLLVVTGVLRDTSDWNGLALFPVVIAAIVYPSLAFHADQHRRGYRFLSHHGVTPRKAWWSRQLVWAGAYALLTAVFLFTCFMGEGQSVHELSTGLRTRPDWAQALFMVVALWALAYACGMLVSILLRSGILAVALGATLTVVLLSLGSFFGRYVGWTVLWVIPVGFFVASRLHAADWLAERRTWRSRLRWMTPALVPFVVVLAITPYLRIHQFPDVPDPGFSPSRLAAQAYSPEGVARLAELVAIAGLPRETIVVDEPEEDADGKTTVRKTTEVILSDEAVKRLVAFAATEPKPGPYLEPLWMDSWASLAEAPALGGRPYVGPHDVVTDLVYSFNPTVRNYERAGRLAEALDYRVAMTRLGMGLSDPGFFSGYEGLAGIRGWARSPGMTPELLKEAIARLDELAPGRLDYTLGPKLRYLIEQRLITDDAYFFKVSGRESTGRELLPVLYPWERTRGVRQLRYVFRQILDDIEFLADSFSDPKAPPVDPVWETKRVGEYREDAFEQVLLGVDTSILRWVSPAWNVQFFERQRRVAQITFAIEAWRLEHDGQLPDSLDQLVGVYLKGVLVNPVTKNPYRIVPGIDDSEWDYVIISGECEIIGGKRVFRGE